MPTIDIIPAEKIRTRIFSGSDVNKLERDLNQWLTTLGDGRVLQVTPTESRIARGNPPVMEYTYSILVVYWRPSK